MTADYNFTVPVEDLIEDAGGYGLPIDVDELVFKHQLKNGFFIEAGAGGGSLSIDKYYNSSSAQPATLLLLSNINCSQCVCRRVLRHNFRPCR